MPPVEWSLVARADLIGIVDYVSDHSLPAAEALRDALRAKIDRLPERPRAYRKGRVAGTREMVVGRHYVVVYGETPQAIRILRVLHTARRWP